jgi:hypothetical protein
MHCHVQGDEGMPLPQRSNGREKEAESTNLLGFFFAPPPPTDLSPEELRFEVRHAIPSNDCD